MNKEDIMELIKGARDKVIKKPQKYRYTCYVGSTILMREGWGDTEWKEGCDRKGEISWGTPSCAKCDGRILGFLELHDWEQHANWGIEDFYKELLKKLEEVN